MMMFENVKGELKMVDTIYCEKCDDFVEYEVKNKEETYKVKGEEIQIKAKVAFCKECGKELFHEELDKENQHKVFDIYRKKHNLLSPEEIKKIRVKYGLNQREMSQLLGWGEITYHRYENGAVPDSAHNNQLLLIQEPKNVKELLKKGKTKLDTDKKEELIDKINELLDSKNKLELHIPKAFYNKLKKKANNNDMELNEYVTFLVTQEYYKQEKEKELQKLESDFQKNILNKHKEKEYESYWLESLKEDKEKWDKSKLQSGRKNNIPIN